tara:strand:+ start:552 stop:848 length:297 start_codon:yes stop_codon:yes gene_type:complete
MTTTWTITTLDREVSNGFVTTAHWTATAVDGDYTASIYSTCGWAGDTPTIAYADLTQETVLGWVWANGVDKQATEDALAAQIELKKNPVVATGTPWSA